MNKDLKDIRVVLLISTYNQAGVLDLCLKSLMSQKVKPHQVLIADDGSSDNTPEIINKYKEILNVPLLHVWHEDEGFRKTLILNKALVQATGNYIVQIDGDIIMDSHFIEDHIHVAEKGYFVRGTRGRLNQQVTQKILNSKEIKLNFTSEGVENRFNAIRIPLIGYNCSRKDDKGYSVRGCNFAYWFDDYVRVNGYNNDLSGWGHEDEELAWRFINLGIMKKIVKLCAVQYHLFHPEAPQNNEPMHRKRVDQIIENKEYLCSNGFNEIK